jgi:hypothetical protein
MTLRSNVSACGTSAASEESEAMEKVNAPAEGGEVVSRELGEQINPLTVPAATAAGLARYA